MQAAIGLAQLEKLPNFIEVRKKNHSRLYEGLKKKSNLIILPKAQKNSNPSWFGFLITLKDECNINRNDIIKELEKSKIATRLLFAGNITRQPVFDRMKSNGKDFRVVNDLKTTDKVMNDSFWVGVYPGMTEDMINYMIKKINITLE
jgi:CDP-6-deoxy-D-xylo-4-hexulose-3-dehydrase